MDAGGYEDPRWWSAEDFAWIKSEARTSPIFWELSADRWYWRGMFDRIPLPMSWPVYVSQAAATAYAQWRGYRLPTEAEFQRAAYGTPDGRARAYPWGDATPSPAYGVYDFTSSDQEPAASHPAPAHAFR